MFSDLTFGSPLWLWGLLALPVLGGLFAWAERQAGVRMARLIQTPRLRAQLTGAASAGRRRVRYLLLLGALAALLLALAAPRWGYETRETHRRGLDVIFVVDVSKSMLATDLPPTRLARARLAVQDFIMQLPGDRVGLVAFAGAAFLQAPLTVDYDAVLNSVNELDTEVIPRGGTNLGGAIELATDAFGKADAGNRAIVLLSDGEPTVEGEGAAGVEAARHAADAGVRIYTLGFGTPEGSLIPLGNSGNFVRDSEGKIVRTKLDETPLKDIAKAGNGFYVRFNGDGAIRTVLQQGLGQLKAGETEARQARRPIERFQWPLGAGLLLLAGAAFIGERRRARAPFSPRAGAVSAKQPTERRAVAVAAAVLWSGLFGLASVGRAETKGSSSNPLDLYQNGKYDEAYKAFQDLAEKNPGQKSLEFNAGNSAYRGKQYDQALDAFGKAMTSADPGLQAKANYNFGNTLFRRGAEKKERDAKIADWKSALEHYDATLGQLKGAKEKADPRLNSDTAFNRAYVQKQLDDLLKQPPPPQSEKNDKQDKQDKKDKQDKGGQSKQDQQKQDQQKQDGNEPPKNDSSGKNPQDNPQGQPGQQKPQNDAQKGKEQDGNQAPTPSPDGNQSQGNSGDKKDENGSKGSQQNTPPDPSQGKDREHGDFQANPGNGQTPPPQPGKPGQGEKEEPGKMSAAQARALLNALKGEDAHVTLGGDQNKHHSDDEPPLKDW